MQSARLDPVSVASLLPLEQAEIDRCLFGPIGNRAISTKNNIVHFSEIVSSSLRVRSNNVFCSRRSDRKNG
jgi:hypothetical protein